MQTGRTPDSSQGHPAPERTLMVLQRIGSSPQFFPALMGAFGVAMGFAAFVLVREETKTQEKSAVVFLLGLVAAAITSYVIESVRERAEGHARGASVDPGRVLGLLVLMAVFEVYVSGAEQVVKVVAGGDAINFVNKLFASGITADLKVLTQLLLFAGLWVVLGAVAAGSMMQTDAVPKRLEPIASAWRVGRGLLLVAGLALVYVVVARIALTIWVLATRPQDYAPAFDTLLPDARTGSPFAQIPVMVASALEALAHTGRWGGRALLCVVAVMVVLLVRILRAPRSGLGYVPALLMLTLVLLALGPFATSGAQFGRLIRIVGATTLTWVAPLVVLAVATPLLRAPARSPKLWGIVAFIVAVVLVVVTWDRLSRPPAPLFVASLVLALVVTAWLFWRGADVVKFWPLVALTLAIAAFEGSSVLQRLTFLTTFKEAALLQTAPLKGGEESRARSGFRAVEDWFRDSLIDASTAKAVAAVGTLPSGTAASVVDSLERSVSQLTEIAYGGAVESLCRPSGVAVIDTLHRDLVGWCSRARVIGMLPRDSVPAFWLALVKAQEPWGDGFSSLIKGADNASQSASFEFHWTDPASAPSQGMLRRAADALPFDPRMVAPAELMARALSDSIAPSTARLWMVLAALAQASPPGAAVDEWLSERERVRMAAAQASRGIMLPDVLSWWKQRSRQLANLVESYGMAGMPVERPKSTIRFTPPKPNRFERAAYAVAALRFAQEQLRERQRERVRGSALDADASASLLLELTLGASFAFWATAGLLAGVSRRDFTSDYGTGRDAPIT